MENAKLAVKWAREELERSMGNLVNLEQRKTQKEFNDKVKLYKMRSFLGFNIYNSGNS